MKRRRRRKPNRPAAKGEQPAPLQPSYPEPLETGDNGEVEASVQEGQPDNPPAEAEAGAQRSGKRRRRGGRGRRQGGAPEPPANAGVTSTGETEALSDDLQPAGSHPEKQEPSVHHAQAHKRQPKGTVVLTIGLPGSGKTSWFRRRAITPLSSDLLRMMLFDDIAEQRYQDLVFSTLRYLLRARLIARMPWNYVDATNLSPRERRGWIKMAQEFGYEVQAVFFDVPVEVCMERNQRRGRIVPEEVMQRMAQKLRPPTFDEGFSKITVVRVKKHARSEPDNVIQAEEESPGPGDENY